MKQRFLRFPDGKIKALTFSYDDGAKADIWLSEIFNEHNMKATFNLNSWYIRKERYEDFMTISEIKEHILKAGHEIAVHGKYHLSTGYSAPIEVIREVLMCREELEDMFGMIVRGMAYSGSGILDFENGACYENTKRFLQDLNIAYARSICGDNDSFSLPDDWYNWVPSAHHNNKDIFKYIDKFLAIDNEQTAPKLMYIWGHSREFESDGNRDRIEKITARLSGKDDIWYATNMEIYGYVKAYNSLIFSVDGKKVYNPTDKKVYFTICGGGVYSVNPGETIIAE